MSQIKYIPAREVTDMATLYIDGLPGVVLEITQACDSYDDDGEPRFDIQFEDANGPRCLTFDAAASVATLV